MKKISAETATFLFTIYEQNNLLFKLRLNLKKTCKRRYYSCAIHRNDFDRMTFQFVYRARNDFDVDENVSNSETKEKIPANVKPDLNHVEIEDLLDTW